MLCSFCYPCTQEAARQAKVAKESGAKDENAEGAQFLARLLQARAAGHPHFLTAMAKSDVAGLYVSLRIPAPH
jgi:hypothetical protein